MKPDPYHLVGFKKCADYNNCGRRCATSRDFCYWCQRDKVEGGREGFIAAYSLDYVDLEISTEALRLIQVFENTGKMEDLNRVQGLVKFIKIPR